MFYSQFDLFLAKKLSLHDVIPSYFKMGYQKKDTKRSTVAQWSWCFRPTLSAWELRRQRSVPKSVLEDEVSDFMSIWRYVRVVVEGFEVFFRKLQMKSWIFYWNCYIYLIVGGLQVHKLSRRLEDQKDRNCEANRWCRMACLIGSRIFLGSGCGGYQYTVYPAQNAWIYIWQNFVTGDIPRFKVLRYSEASLFEL